MEKKYVKPAIKIQKIEMDELMQSASINSSSPTNGLTGNDPTVGGDNDGTHEVSAKQNTFSVWNDDEE